ncbi:energy transducer TonB [Joostella atrarenae]|uniref:Energy transducer TonB n=1 Tax=Joostella atrarenae TaxID=679257 RepID=A0ABS9J673_9FLAO|nr:energy transducer TonB [Joostella atrarenae]MCF8715909.1 energy transducer TonB [Joostella atrarenae]
MNILKFIIAFFISNFSYSQVDTYIFSEVDEIPYFTNSECDIKTEECFKTDLLSHIQKVFSYPETAYQNGIEGKVYVQFKINKDGYFTDVKARSKDSLFQSEGIRIIKSLPKITPAFIDKNPVSTVYSYAIHFNIDEEKTISSYDKVAKAPVIFQNCKRKTSDVECFKKELFDFMFDHLEHKNLSSTNYNQTSSKEIEYIAKFYIEISTSGAIENLTVVSNNKSLKSEIERIFNENKISLIPASNSEGNSIPCYFSDELKIVAVTREVRHPISGQY